MFDLKVRSRPPPPRSIPGHLPARAPPSPKTAGKEAVVAPPENIMTQPANSIRFYPARRARQRRTPGRRRSTRTSPRSRPRSSTSRSSRSSRPSTDTTRTRSQRPSATKRELPAGVDDVGSTPKVEEGVGPLETHIHIHASAHCQIDGQEDGLTRCTHEYGQELLESEDQFQVHLLVEE